MQTECTEHTKCKSHVSLQITYEVPKLMVLCYEAFKKKEREITDSKWIETKKRKHAELNNLSMEFCASCTSLCMGTLCEDCEENGEIHPNILWNGLVDDRTPRVIYDYTLLNERLGYFKIRVTIARISLRLFGDDKGPFWKARIVCEQYLRKLDDASRRIRCAFKIYFERSLLGSPKIVLYGTKIRIHAGPRCELSTDNVYENKQIPALAENILLSLLGSKRNIYRSSHGPAALKNDLMKLVPGIITNSKSLLCEHSFLNYFGKHKEPIAILKRYEPCIVFVMNIAIHPSVSPPKMDANNIYEPPTKKKRFEWM